MILAIPYIAAIVGTIIMKKIYPEDNLYPAYAFGICLMLTILVGIYVSAQ